MDFNIVTLLDLFGTAVFAVTGAVKGVRCKLDIFGVVVLACCVGVGGGMVRDCIIGALPAAALKNEMYLIICIVTGILIFLTARYWMHFRNMIQMCDAVGLGVFTAIGAGKGAAFGLGFIGIILCGVFTAIGGGIIRDVFTGTIPAVLKNDFYATASLIGGILFCSLQPLHLSSTILFLIVAAVVTGIRLWAMHYRIQLPRS